MDRLRFGLEVKFAQSAQDGTFSGYASVFDKEDLGGDVIVRGAFRESLADWALKGKLPKMLLHHGGGFLGSASDAVPIGKWTKMSEDSVGLAVEGRLFIDNDRGKTIYVAMKEGELDGLSIGYRPKEFVLGTKPDEPERTIKSLDLREVSVVLFGMNEHALVDNVKTGPTTIREFEAALRERLGFSCSQAKAIAEHGFKSPPRSRDETGGDENTGLKAAVDEFAAGLKGFSLPPL